MARLPLSLPPGVFRNGTRFQSKGRWYETLLTRWYGIALGPVLGWRRKGSSTLTGSARAAVAWPDNSGNTWIGVGTDSKLYVCNRLGAAFDITPIGFTVGRADATTSGGYGTGPYGSSTYGTPRPDTTTTILDATQWTLDTWGEDLLGVSPDDGKLYEWVAGGTGTPAAKVTNSPDCKAVVVTPESFVFALATSDERTLDWCDQQNNNLWAPASTNQAGSFPLQTAGRLLCGKPVRGLTLIFSDVDTWAAQYIGGTLVYGFTQVGGNGSGSASRGAVAAFGTGEAVWMSPAINFWAWNGGAVVPIECAVREYIIQDINLVQISKVVAITNSANSEVEFRYCSASSNEIDRAVVWNYKDNTWCMGRASRTCGVDKAAALFYPVLISSDGKLYDHELGWAYDDASPYAISGPVELGNGDNIMWIMELYPDDLTVGDVTASFTVRRNADDTGTDYGPYTLTQKTDLRFSGGQIALTVTGATMTSWRFGIPKLEAMQGEGRG